MANGNPAGSQWCKWDLHVHTPCSLYHKYPGAEEEAWAQFLDDLESLPSEFRVLGINDYIFVDGYERVLREKKSGRLKNIDLILPVVELRLDKFAGIVKRDEHGAYSRSDWNRVNLHVVFDELDPNVIRQQFLNALTPSYSLIPESHGLRGKWKAVISEDSLKQLGQMVIDAAPAERRHEYAAPLLEGFNNLCVSLESVCEALNNHVLHDRYLLAVGKAEWANMKWNDNSIAEKRNVINSVKIVFSASESPEKYAAARKQLADSRVLDKLLDCSDAHNLSNSTDKDRLGNCSTWIKADPTFEGLRHAMEEFDLRVHVGDRPDKLKLVENNSTKYAKALRIKKHSQSSLTEPWFDADLPLSHDLVAVIGNKGSGKSALADVFALVGNTRNYSGFSFLTNTRFRDPRTGYATQFIGEILWADGSVTSKKLDEDPSDTDVERVKYIPQSYLEAICNNLETDESSHFEKELRGIIFRLLKPEDQMNFASLDELLEYKVAEHTEELARMRKVITTVNRDIERIEARLGPDYAATIQGLLDSKRRELQALEAARPPAEEDPNASPTATGQKMADTERLSILTENAKSISGEIEVLRIKKTALQKKMTAADRALQAVDNHKKAYERFSADLQLVLNDLDPALKSSNIVQLGVDKSLITRVRTAVENEVTGIDGLLDESAIGGLLERRAGIDAEITDIKSKMDENQRKYVLFKEQLAQWEEACLMLIGSDDKQNSLKWCEGELKRIEELPASRQSLRETRADMVRQLHSEIMSIVDEYRHLYMPLRAFLEKVNTGASELPLNFNARVIQSGFADRFLSMLNRQTKGSFSGVEESNRLVDGFLREADFMDCEAVLRFLDKIDDHLHFDRRTESTNEEAKIEGQLRKGYAVSAVYDLIFGLDYLKPRYSLTYGGQEIAQLSPGERGLLLLVFYLLVDSSDTPIVIDQPEENLDNQTIYKVLVSCIKSAKQRRQVIMVTHNPNLAVVCDAEQVIVASCDKTIRQLSYSHGSIESPEIKSHVIDILEGTAPAFRNRGVKYRL